MKTQIKILISLLIAGLLLVIIPLKIMAQPQSDLSQDQNRPQPYERRLAFVKEADFYLRDGQFVTGRLIEEDKYKVVVEQLEGSELVVRTYSKREIDTRTLDIGNIPEIRYFEQLGDYFASRTWDFRDDTDDFIQAIRSYEKAKRATVQADRREDEIKELEAKIDELKKDRQVWAEQVEDRAKLKKLEFDATFDERMKQLERQVLQNYKITEVVSGRIEEYIRQSEKNFRGFDQELSKVKTNFSRSISDIERKIEENRQLIRDVNRYYYYPRFNYRDRRR
ncbi:MAG: hypothetical protein JW804_00295 [Sedimentisphaerales bacterium]|nr:hypothetical protein [Sedimentisphaerales bacterium]